MAADRRIGAAGKLRPLGAKLGADAIRTVRGVGYMMPAASVDGAPSAGAD